MAPDTKKLEHTRVNFFLALTKCGDVALLFSIISFLVPNVQKNDCFKYVRQKQNCDEKV